MNKFLPNHNFKTKLLNKIELDNFINKCKSLNILTFVKTKRPSYNRIEYIHNNKNWICLLNKKFLKPHKVHKFKINQNKKINYLKLSIFPDGGVSRIKVMGTHL